MRRILFFILTTSFIACISSNRIEKVTMLEDKKVTDFALVIHGGAGTILKENMTPKLEEQYHEKLREALQAGYGVLESGGSSIDAVEAAIIPLEDSPLFNAGKGAVFTNEERNEMDASFMDGATKMPVQLGVLGV